MALSYLAVLVFTLFALSLSLTISPGDATPAKLRSLMFDTPFLHFLGKVGLIAFTASITGVALASTAGYAFSRVRRVGRGTTLNGLLMTQMFPAVALLLPLYLILIKLGLINSYLGLIIIYTATALPFCIWQLKGYYDTIPLSLEEAASIEGCTRWQSFYLVVLPLVAPALVITALFSFMTVWNEFFVSAIVLRDIKIFALPVGLQMPNTTTQWSPYAAGALLVSIPVLILFLVLSRFLDSDVNSGAVKG
jgi:arabinogalactan oligomer/maltooligosaccharide transport system permease protein